MKITYDPEADAMYIHLTDADVTRTEEVNPDVIADYSGKNLVGIELLDVSKKLPDRNLKSVKSVPFELL